MRTALGLSVHTGWAAGVLLTADDRVVARFHVDMGKAEHGGNVHAYHAAAEAKDPVAAIEQVRTWALEGARDAFDAMTSEHAIATCAIIAANVPAPSSLEKILASHTLLHAAEGELFRDVLATVAGERRIAVQLLRAQKLKADAQRALGDPDAWVKAVGKGLGPPWSKDHRDAALAAKLVLA
jgi:hypothetical protein